MIKDEKLKSEELFSKLQRTQIESEIVNYPTSEEYITATITRYEQKRDSLENYNEAYISLANHYLY